VHWSSIGFTRLSFKTQKETSRDGGVESDMERGVLSFKKGKSSPKLGFVFRAGITVSVLGYLALKLHWAELGMQLMRSDPVWLATAFLLLGLAFLLGSVRWWLLLKVQGISLSLKTVSLITLVGQFFNSFLLGTTGGDVIRTLYTLRYAPNKKAGAAISIITDRAMGLFILLCCAVAVLPWQLRFVSAGDQMRAVFYGLLSSFGLALGIGLTMVVLQFQRQPVFFQNLWRRVPRREIIESLVAAFRQHRISYHLTLLATIWSFAACVVLLTSGYCIARAIHLKATYMQMLTILSVVTCLISLPISIGGHGIREGAFILMFSVFGIISLDRQMGSGQEQAILFSVLFFALFLGWSLIGGVAYLMLNSGVQETALDSQVAVMNREIGENL
jgi:uncharacterized protein (TIRG00374 family)